jgi:hypothetical protein
MGAHFANGPVLVQINFFVLDRPPQPLDENVIEDSPAARKKAKAK